MNSDVLEIQKNSHTYKLILYIGFVHTYVHINIYIQSRSVQTP